MPHPNPEELTSHFTKLQKSQQVIGYAPEGEGAEMPHPNPEELTSHFTKLQKSQQVIGYPQPSE